MGQKRWRLWVAIALVAIVVLPGAGLLLRLAYLALRGTLGLALGLALDLATIGVILFLIAAFCAPLEALGWWAGWYGEEVTARPTVGELAAPVAGDLPISRFVVYLDGIGQASYEALPEGEDFLRRLARRLP